MGQGKALDTKEPPAILNDAVQAVDQDRQAAEIVLAKRRIELLEGLLQQQGNLVKKQRSEANEYQRQLQEQAQKLEEVGQASKRCEALLMRLAAGPGIEILSEDL